MTTIVASRADWDGLTADQQAAVRASVVIEPTGWLAVPATGFDDQGVPIVLWDDPLLTADHAAAVAAAFELWR